jgi:hypothetical protein
MSVPDPHRAWMLFMSDPVDFILMFVAVAVIVGGGIWFLRSQINKGQIATLKGRVNLAKEEQEGLEKQVEAFKRETASQQAIIKELWWPSCAGPAPMAPVSEDFLHQVHARS